MIKTWDERCEEHPSHQSGMVSNTMIQARMQEEIDDLRAALAQPEQEPVAHSVVAGALFDFMGWLTSREKRLTLSSLEEASPAVEAITEFAKMRGLRLEDAQVEHWQAILTHPPQRKPLRTVIYACPICAASLERQE